MFYNVKFMYHAKENTELPYNAMPSKT